MLKPRLRIPRPSSLLRPSHLSGPAPATPSPWAAAAPQRLQQRWQHAAPKKSGFEVPEMPEHFQFEGIEDLYSTGGYQLAWTKYQTWLLEELNKKIDANQLDGGETVKAIAIKASREPAKASVFNFASMAHNNEFFFNGIAPSAGKDPSELLMPGELQKQLAASFGSVETLQREMIMTANAMFGPGFVWLVKQNDYVSQKNAGQFRVLTTYLAGSPYPGAHWRRQGIDMNSIGGMSDESGETTRQYFNNQNKANNRAPVHGAQVHGVNKQEEERSRSPGGADLTPVLCVNTWEHAWLPDYGCDGKFQFLNNWWRLINWNRVWERSLGDKALSQRANAIYDYNRKPARDEAKV